MRMSRQIRWARFNTPLRFRFKHASADRNKASSVIVEIREGRLTGYGEACPRAYVTGETEETATTFLERHGAALSCPVKTIDDLRSVIAENQTLIDQNPAAFCALELALLDLLAKQSRVNVEAMLNLKPPHDKFQYSAVIGDGGPIATRLQSIAYQLYGLHDFKVKLGTEPTRDVKRFASLPKNAAIRVDANNLFDNPEQIQRHINALGRDIWAIEEPLKAGDVSGQAQVSQEMGVKIILDESLYKLDQLSGYDHQQSSWIANIRVSKCGGVLRAMELASAAQSQGMDIILGAHVGETSLLSRAAMTVGQALIRPPVACEGAFGNILLKKDITKPVIQFGRKGVLKTKRYGFHKKVGWGLSVKI